MVLEKLLPVKELITQLAAYLIILIPKKLYKIIAIDLSNYQVNDADPKQYNNLNLFQI